MLNAAGLGMGDDAHSSMWQVILALYGLSDSTVAEAEAEAEYSYSKPK